MSDSRLVHGAGAAAMKAVGRWCIPGSAAGKGSAAAHYLCIAADDSLAGPPKSWTRAPLSTSDGAKAKRRRNWVTGWREGGVKMVVGFEACRMGIVNDHKKPDPEENRGSPSRRRWSWSLSHPHSTLTLVLSFSPSVLARQQRNRQKGDAGLAIDGFGD